MQAVGKLVSSSRQTLSLVRIPTCSMYTNPYIARFKNKPKAEFQKQDTGLTGLDVCERPHYELTSVYNRILRVLDNMPKEAAYRKYTEAIINQRLGLLQSEQDIDKLEEKIGMGQIEEVLEQAQYELETAKDMLKYAVWEPLAEQPPPNQWTWPI